jgi:hypothetical protein
MEQWFADLRPQWKLAAEEWAGSAEEQMGRIGVRLVKGLVDGTASAKDLLVQAALQIAAHFFPPLKLALGLFSPSKVTYGFGQNIVLGMIGGMDSMGGALAAATGRMTGTVTGGLALPQVGGISGVVGRPATLTAKINTADTSAHPPWALDWLAKGNIELRYAGEDA